MSELWFVARVSILPTLLLGIPFTVLVVFILNTLLLEFGAADFSGVGAASAAVTQISPIVTVLVIARSRTMNSARPRAIPALLHAVVLEPELVTKEVIDANPFASMPGPGAGTT